uniref:C2H2-type domain-containing protein n=1 Tax=viral metagenome TaxID=1070528 RepID=A0A6C0E242_9ZZZZ
METAKTKKNAKTYYCEKCYFMTYKKTDFDRHLLTAKHKCNLLATDSNDKNDITYACEFCEKEYKDRTGLWKHKKLCNKPTANQESAVSYDPIQELKESVKYLIQENSEMKNIMMEFIKSVKG